MIKRIKGWFTNKNKQLELDKTSNINPIGVARNVDLKKIIDRITQIENTLNNLPPPTTPPDLTPYALKNSNNEFTESQTIKNNAAFVEFKDAAGNRKGYVGKASANSDNIVLVSERGDVLVQSTKNIVLNVGTRNGVIGERAPSANNHLTNKKYVDDTNNATRQYVDTKIRQEIDAIPPLDLSDFASLSQDNQYTGNNQFNNRVNFQNDTNLNGDAKYFGNITEGKHVATKEYVDSKSSVQPSIVSANLNQTKTINKSDLTNGVYSYEFDYAPQHEGTGIALIYIDTISKGNASASIKQSFCGIYSNYANRKVWMKVFSRTDLYAGGTGSFAATITGTVYFLKIFNQAVRTLEE